MKQLCKYSLLVATGTVLSLASALAAKPLTLEGFLGQVNEASPALRASDASARSFESLSDTGSLVTSPYVFGSWKNLDDKQEYPNSAIQGSRTQANQFSAGLGLNSSVGLNAVYTYNVTRTEITGAQPAFLPLPDYYTNYNKLELSQSLLRNGFGSETRAQRDAMNSANRARAYGARYQNLAQTVEAEAAYWRLAFARRTLDIQKDSLDRSERALQWAKRRVGLQLGDRSDLLQAQASYDLRRLELSNAEEEIRNAARAFNIFRNQEGDKVADALYIPTLDEILRRTEKVEPAGTRLDLKAAEEQQRLSLANAQLENEKVKPQLDLVASLAWNGRDAARGAANSEAFSSKHPTTALGVNFRMPLALGLVKRSLEGGALAQEAANLNFDFQRMESDRSWDELVSKLKEARGRLALLRTIEAVQKDKYENERQRLMKGRTTTYQSIIFEQDYATTQLSSLRSQYEVLQLQAQMKLFRGEM